jgi:hypothetical protein
MRNDNDFFARILKAKPEDMEKLKESITTYYGQPKIMKGTVPTQNTSIKRRRNNKPGGVYGNLQVETITELGETIDESIEEYTKKVK